MLARPCQNNQKKKRKFFKEKQRKPLLSLQTHFGFEKIAKIAKMGAVIVVGANLQWADFAPVASIFFEQGREKLSGVYAFLAVKPG